MARKIESLMNKAIAKGERDWKLANTVVQTDDNGVARVFLYGNQIAEIGEGYIQMWDGHNQTYTTKSRLNAILREHGLKNEYVFQKNYQWFIQYNGSPLPFFSGMRLN